MSYNYDKIPQELKNLNRWVLWKLKINEKGKSTKIPINAKNGYGAKSNDSETWVSFDEAISKVEYFNCKGVGFMLGNGYFGIDIDHQLDNVELINEFILTLNSYTEISQSGEGIHIICKGALPVGNRRKGNIEMYDNARFFAMTGNAINEGANLEDRTEEVKPLYYKYLGDKEEENKDGDYVYKTDYKNQTYSELTDEEVLIKAQESTNGNLFTCLYYGQWEGLYESQSQADLSFCSLLAFWTCKNEEQIDRIFRSSKLYRTKWDEKRGNTTYAKMTISKAIANCKDTYKQSYNNSQVFNPLTGEVSNKKEYDLNDTGNAIRFIDRFGTNIRYNFDNKTWMVFDGKTWVEDSKQITKKQADIMINEMKTEAIQEVDKDLRIEKLRNVKHLSSNSGKEAMLKEAMHIGNTPTTNKDYNIDNYLLNCFNGVMDLKTGKLMAHDKKYMLSKNTHIECDLVNDPERWIKFLLEIFGGNQDMVDFIQCALGYTLTGDTKEQVMFQCYGDGANGKSVFFDIVYKVFGDYGLNSQIESFLARQNQTAGASSEIARTNSARFIRTNEPNDNSRLNEGLVKQLVGGDITTARFLYGKEFEFKPVFKLWIATNYKLVVRGTDKGIWRRMIVIPFKQTFEEEKQDKNLTEKLLQEAPQILGWMIKGCLKWQKIGLNAPDEIRKETASYKKEMDIVLKFITECIKEDKTKKAKASDVFKEYKMWARTSNEWDGMTQTKFGIEMGKKFEKKIINGNTYYIGIVLKKDDDSYVYEREKI